MIDPRSVPFTAHIHLGAKPAKSITFDSREVNENTAFAALQGEYRHGNDFIAQALNHDAPFVLSNLATERGIQVQDAVVALRAWARHKRDSHTAPIIGVTGSAGKTTAKEYIRAAVDGIATPGNLNTLNAIACFLLEQAGESEQPLVVEMGIDRIGEMAELMQLVHPDYGVVTSIGEAHLEFFGSVETVSREKGLILHAQHGGLLAETYAHYHPNMPTYGLSDIQNLRIHDEQAVFDFAGVPVELNTSSLVVVEAAVAGLKLAQRLGLNLEAAAARLRNVQVSGGRYRVIKREYTLIDDSYNANPVSMRAALDSLSQFSGRKIAVLGDMRELGEHSEQYHKDIALYAAQKADVVYSTGEFAHLLSANAHSKPELTAVLKATLQAGDVVLFKASRRVQLEDVIAEL